MLTKEKPAFLNHFVTLEDPRVDRKKLYPLDEILLVALCGTICTAQSWRDFVSFGNEKLVYLRKFLTFKNGIPSKNTFSRVFSSLDPSNFKRCFLSWVESFQSVAKDIVAIDGKKLRRTFDKRKNQSPIHMISAFASESRLVLGQEKVHEKSNEITAIPKLLELLDLSGSVVSIDAGGTQKNIAQKITEKSADYVLALKKNHPKLHEETNSFFQSENSKLKSLQAVDYYECTEKNRGRIEERRCFATDNIEWLTKRKEWKNLKSVAMVESQVTIGKKITTDRRFFISSLSANAKKIAEVVRSHWAIENSLHWILDVTMGEDFSRVRKDNAPENMAIVRHISVNMLQNAKKLFKDTSIRGLQKKAGWGNSSLDLILSQEF